MKVNELENLEIELLLEAVWQRYGYDFRSYARASIRRRIIQFMKLNNFFFISDMIAKLLHDKSFFEEMVRAFSITVTEMFRDPKMYLSLRNLALPLLKSYPYIKIWHAGCATGEDAYSLAILMKEEELSDKATFFATDFNNAALYKAREGLYSLDKAREYSLNYQEAGGRYSFSKYYHAQDGALAVDSSLKQMITFANHNLVTDQVFAETHLIFCRNVLIYFSKELQARVIKLFHESLVRGGYLCLGRKESILYSSYQDKFKEVDSKNKIYQKQA